MIGERERYERAFERFEMPEPSWERLALRRDRKRRNQRVAAGVVGIAVFLAAIWIVTAGATFDRSKPAVTGPPVPPSGRVGFIGLPPEGATPSAPRGAELVLSMWGRSTTDSGHLFRAWLYADGRLIWSQEGSFPYGANDTATGYLEQHLTLKGVVDMRSEILSTGLFERDNELLSQERGIFGTVRVRADGGDFVKVRWANRGIYPNDAGTLATPNQEQALGRLDELMRHPHTWLPLDSWADDEIEAYVPSAFAACYEPAERGIETSSILQSLPAPAADLLRVAPIEGRNCSRLSTDEARALVRILDDAGIPPNQDERDVRVSYLFEPSAPLAPGPIENTVHLFLEPYFPHGAFPCSACG